MEENIGERLIIEGLRDQQKQLRSIDARLRHIEVSIGILKSKAAILGGLAGLVPSLFLWWLNRG